MLSNLQLPMHVNSSSCHPILPSICSIRQEEIIKISVQEYRGECQKPVPRSCQAIFQSDHSSFDLSTLNPSATKIQFTYDISAYSLSTIGVPNKEAEYQKNLYWMAYLCHCIHGHYKAAIDTTRHGRPVERNHLHWYGKKTNYQTASQQTIIESFHARFSAENDKILFLDHLAWRLTSMLKPVRNYCSRI